MRVKYRDTNTRKPITIEDVVMVTEYGKESLMLKLPIPKNDNFTIPNLFIDKIQLLEVIPTNKKEIKNYGNS